MIDKTKMIDSKGAARTASLFWEIKHDKESALFTMADHDKTTQAGLKLISLKKLYLEEEDPLEYTFVDKYLLSWAQWQKIANNNLLKPHVEKWREELSLKLRSAAVKTIIDQMASENPLQAAKYIAEKGWNKQEVGRPNKKETAKAASEHARMTSEFNEDISRLRLELPN